MRKIISASAQKIISSMLLVVAIVSFSQNASAKIDDSADIFFPKSLAYLQVAQAELPVFWWNFVVIKPRQEKSNFEKAEKVCLQLKKNLKTELRSLVCGDEIESFLPVLQSWADDVIYREPFLKAGADKQGYLSKLNAAYSEMSFVSSENKALFLLKQKDPFNQWEMYLKKNQVFTNVFKREQGFLIDEETKRIVIPIQFLAAPNMKSAEGVMASLASFSDTFLVGAHSSAYLNEKQVHIDLNLVSIVSLTAFTVFILYLVSIGRLAALLLVPPVAMALGLASWITQLIYGSIHGLTLAFGSGIVGLALDYGLHGAFKSDSKQTWKSNTVGLLTTLTGLGVLAFSGIPLIQQMMIFGIFGIIFGFIFYFILSCALSRHFKIKSVRVFFPEFKYSWIVVLALIVCGAYSAHKLNMGFDLRRFNYQTPELKEITDWFYGKEKHQEQFLVLHEKQDLYTSAKEEFEWTEKNKISYLGLYNLLPDQISQQQNLLTWENQGCSFFQKRLNPSQQKVFKPFLKNICEIKHQTLQFSDLEKKIYLNHLIGHEKFLSLLFAENDKEQSKIRQQFPAAHSLVETIKGFSASLEKDLHWMIPTAIALCFLILLIYYQSLILSGIALIPFFTGVGLFFAASVVLNTYLDLISVLGLLMVFGFSIDYGVFATDSFAFPHRLAQQKQVETALWFAAMTNIIGFFPMTLAKHPILYQLGFALFYGTIGTYIGTRWGIPAALRWAKINKVSESL